MSKSERFLTLDKELQPYKKMMAEAADIILDQGVSNYPIFIAHQQEFDMGIVLTPQNEKSRWAIHASSLEEFVSKQIIFPEKVEEFKANYKDASHSLCIFVLSELGAQFIFLPR